MILLAYVVTTIIMQCFKSYPFFFLFMYQMYINKKMYLKKDVFMYKMHHEVLVYL